MDAHERKKMEDLVVACNRCGFCTSYCPTYLSTGNENHSPRGRNQAFRALLEGKVADPTQMKEAIDTCLLCGECTSVCFSEVPTAHLMVQARQLIHDSAGVPRWLSFFFRSVLAHPKRLSLVLKIAFLGKRWGISWAARKSGLLKRLSPALHAADELIVKAPNHFLLETPRAKPYLERVFQEKERDLFVEQQKNRSTKTPDGKPVRPKIAYFPVCGSQYLHSSTGEATLKLFEILGLDFTIPDLLCCGLPAASVGVLEHVRVMAKENMVRLERGRFEAIVSDDSSCTAHIKEYPKYFVGDAALSEKAYVLAGKVRELSSFLVQWGLMEKLKGVSWKEGPVAYHDPCKAQYSQKVTQPPRELLGAINGLKVVPIAEPDQCCGGGGTYSFVHAELSRDVLSRKIKSIIESGCRVVVTSSTSCQIQLASGLRDHRPRIEVLHLTEFLARVLS